MYVLVEHNYDTNFGVEIYGSDSLERVCVEYGRYSEKNKDTDKRYKIM